MLKLIPKSKWTDLVIMYLIFITGSFIVYISGAGLFIYNLIVLLPSAIFILSKNKISSHKIMVQGALLGVFAEVLVDSFAIYSHAWVSPTMFKFTIIGLPIENYIWNILFVILMLVFYEHFFDKHKTSSLPNIHKYWLLLVAIVSIVFPIIYMVSPTFFGVSYFYAVFLAIIIIIEILISLKYQTVVTRAFAMATLLLPLSFIHEITSLEYKHWFFEQGYHLFYIPLLSFQVPIEEIIFYIAGPVAVVIFYELLMDNGK